MTIIALPTNLLCLETELTFPLLHRKIIEEISRRIKSVGLLNPLIVTKIKGRYLVIDGKKRLHAIKKLARQNKLPRTLHTVPCLLSDSDPTTSEPINKPLLLSDYELVQEIIKANEAGKDEKDIIQMLECSQQVIRQALSLKSLCPKLEQAFMNTAINLAQAAALATIPNPQAQWDLLVQLGPFVSEPDIIKAIAKGKTVLELPNGDVLLLPSRTPILPSHTALNSQNLRGLDIAA